jgi:hypothetical protein
LARTDLLGLQFELLAGDVMNLRFAALVILIALLGAVAEAVESSVQVQTLFNSDAFLTKFLIPLRLRGLGQNSDVISYRLLDATEQCGLMRDPFRGEIFLLKCERPAAPRLEFVLNQTGTRVILNFGPIAVNGADGAIAPMPTPTPTPTPPPSPGAAGKAVFTLRCVSCHSVASALSAPSRALIDQKLATIPGMIPLRPLLTATDVLNLEVYLANPSAY